MEEKRIPKTLDEAYRLRDSSMGIPERDFYQEHIYRLRREEYRARGIRTEISSRRRERQSALEFSREMFFMEVAEIMRRRGDGPGRASRDEIRRYTSRLDTHAFLSSSHPRPGAVNSTVATTWTCSFRHSPNEAYSSRGLRAGGRGEFRACSTAVQDWLPRGVCPTYRSNALHIRTSCA